jgi:putative hydrolase of the HAD superfamily
MPSAKELDAVTLDAFGTLVELNSPTGHLRRALAARGVEAETDAVEAAFAAEVAYYVEHKVEGRDEASLERLRRVCTGVFLEALGADLDAGGFAPDFAAALVFKPLVGVVEALGALQGAGLVLACVSDWDMSVGDQLGRAGVGRFLSTVVSSAEIGVEKPDPAVFRAALERLGVSSERTLHIGDGEGDRAGARAAGLAFEPAPVVTLPQRLGL